ncbi:hypothetical protein BDA99DRAFT_554071 [Phascolomyces articulosus]|uniref:Uncharacterized protein n=1 Tax=Phascolomyces articulosus TaxID=60185 RepID=A0AAD5KR84_9FUNG|nr:hypothetical protein BDA99DRAFT_554071 [Phascolomyces articulosus]
MPTFSTLLRDVGSTLPLITAVTALHAGMYVSVVVIHKIIDYCWYKHPDRAAVVATGAFVAHSVFFRYDASARTDRVLRLAKFLGLVLPLPVLPAHLGTSVPVVDSRIKVATVRPMTHCLDIEEGHGLGEEVSFFEGIRQQCYEAQKARSARLASVQSTLVGRGSDLSVLLPYRNRWLANKSVMASVLRPLTPSFLELPQTSRAALGDSKAVSDCVPESQKFADPPTERDIEMEDLVEQFESMHLCTIPASPSPSIMSLDSFDETPLVVEPFGEDAPAVTDLGDSNVVPIFMPVEVEAISDGNVDMLEGDSSTAFVVVDEYAPGCVQQEENPFNLQHVVEPFVDPAVVLNVPASGLATASMRMTSGLATASMSVTSELASAFKSPVVDNVTSATLSASGSTMRMTSGSAMSMTSGLASASMSSGSGLASASTDLASGSAMRKTSGSAMSNMTSGLASASMSSGFGLATASTDLASGSAMRKTSGSAMSNMTSGLASASMSSGFGLATASTDLASGSAMRKTSGSVMSQGSGHLASGLASASTRMTSGSAMSMTSGLASASMSSLPAVVSVIDPSVSTPQENNCDFNFTFLFDPSLPPAVSSAPPPPSSTSSSFTFSFPAPSSSSSLPEASVAQLAVVEDEAGEVVGELGVDLLEALATVSEMSDEDYEVFKRLYFDEYGVDWDELVNSLMDFCVVRLCFRRLGVVCRAFGLGIVFALWMNLCVVRLRGRFGLAVATLVWFWVSPRRLGRRQVALLVLQGDASGGFGGSSRFRRWQWWGGSKAY